MSDEQTDLRHVRVIDLIRKMDRHQQQLFAHDCAERTIDLCQEVVPYIHSLKEQLHTARDYIFGRIDRDEMLTVLEAVKSLVRNANENTIWRVSNSCKLDKRLLKACDLYPLRLANKKLGP